MKRGIEFDRVKMHKDTVKDRYKSVQFSVGEPTAAPIDVDHKRCKSKHVEMTVYPTTQPVNKLRRQKTFGKLTRQKTIYEGRQSRIEKESKLFANL